MYVYADSNLFMKFIRFAFLVSIITSATTGLHAQSTAAALKKNAFALDISEVTANKRLAGILHQHSIIMMGEMHGTQEPALFVSYMVDQLVRDGKMVNLGLEIPAVHMKEFTAARSPESLKQSFFFSKGFPDGRPGSAWFALINKYIGNPSVHLFFFDVDPDAQVADRDKGMYAVVKDAILQHPNAPTILLSGNIHNRLIPFGGANTLACYLQQDTSLHTATGVLAINHQFKFGAMENVTSEGFGIHKTGPTPTRFSETLPFKTYFSLLDEAEGPYNAVFYTEEVTPSSAMTRP
jgi:hypothetical protein